MSSTRRGSEMTTLRDERTGRVIWRLTNSEQEDKHTYRPRQATVSSISIP
ncbi:MAG TPA: hypothetical protein G4O02_01600 [Caldilineae bacterium]|nr:hypothetical protein [Caldilineae bacterium]